MLKTFLQLLGEDAPVFRRYAWMAVAHGLLCGLTIAALAPLLSRLLAGDLGGAGRWLAALLAGVVACWAWRRRVEQAGVRVGTTVLQTARHRLGDHVASLPVGWFTPQNTARLSHIVTQGTMAVAQLPAHVFTPVIGGLVTPFVIVAAFALHWQLGLIALAALPLLAGVLFLTGGWRGARTARSMNASPAPASAWWSSRRRNRCCAPSMAKAAACASWSRRWTGNGNRRRG